MLATVLSVHTDRVILDAGALALSKDSGTGSQHFGPVLDLAGRPIGKLHLVGLSQEHGKVRGEGLECLSVGDKVRIPPNHSCLAMACFEQVHAFRDASVEAVWSPCRGW